MRLSIYFCKQEKPEEVETPYLLEPRDIWGSMLWTVQLKTLPREPIRVHEVD